MTDPLAAPKTSEIPIQLDEEERTVCFCHCVMLTEVVAAIAKGADTLEKIQSETLASTGCGGCECDVLEILEKYGPKKNPENK